MRIVRERVPAVVATLAGVVLALPSVVAPTWRLTTLDSERGVILFDQQDWSWGRSRVLGAGGSVVQDLPNAFGLVVLLILLAASAAGALAWLLTPAGWASVVAPVTSAALLGRLATTVSERHGATVRDDVHGLAATGATTIVGALESLAALALVVAVALMVASVTGVRMPSAWVTRLRALAAGGPDERDPGDPGDPGDLQEHVRATTRRAGATITSRPAGEHLDAPAVDLGDEERR
ncbi:hypothetical protein [Terrabacter sp. MAHUQ-38]|uniref:hypothetical protein n=1 Tax=unclassified Terrabacter TaxID=2630222 RepID=UPI00165E488E|nr:hypothetical protein [Terrabacter sp. MAHUQ-38]MBC9819809.1 hypothetical protein [Terrabacter sp. MAHUQ-38]